MARSEKEQKSHCACCGSESASMQKETFSALGSIFLKFELQEKLQKSRNVKNDLLKSHDLKGEKRHEIFLKKGRGRRKE